LNAANRLVWTCHAWNGYAAQHTAALHEQYGEIVRVNPNELSYINAQAWQGEMYGILSFIAILMSVLDIAGHFKISTGEGNLPKENRNCRPEPNKTPSIVSNCGARPERPS
jgi:hypothetical protein